MVRPANCGRCGEIEICTQSQDGMRPQLFSPSRSMSARIRVARLGELQPLEHRRHAAGLHPLRQQVLQRIGAGGVRVGVAIDVEAARLGVGDHLERGFGLAPVVGARAFEMHDLDMHVAVLGDVDRLLHGVEHLVRLVAQMGEVGRRCGASARGRTPRISSALGVGAGRREQARTTCRARRRRSPCSSSSIIASSSAAVGARSAMPITISRSVLWPTSMPAFTDVAGKLSRYSGKRQLAKRRPRRARAKDNRAAVRPCRRAPARPRSRNGR